jgi:osmotically-inducible protein OsmY
MNFTTRPALGLATTVLAAALAAGLTSGCAPLLVAGAVVGGGMALTDRRTSGAQLEDQSIEFKAAARVRELATLGRVNVTSYNRTVLITGEVPGANEKLAVERAVARVENVKLVVNELAVGDNAPLATRSSDTVLATKVKATLIDAKDLQANAFKVVAERGIVYLMGRVTEREATRGTELTRSISGVQRVVPVFELLSEAELASMTRGGAQPAPVATAASAAASAPAPTPTPPPAPATPGTVGVPAPPREPMEVPVPGVPVAPASAVPAF